MPRGGTGTYTLPVTLVDGTTATATQVMTDLNDIALALTGSTAADGQTPITGNWNWQSKNISGVGTLTTTSLSVLGNSAVVGNSAVTGSVVIAGSASVGTTFSAGDAVTVTKGGLTVTAGGAKVTAGGLTVSADGASITGNSTITGTVTITSTATAANGTSGTQVVNYSQFPATLGATGAQSLPSGKLEKWGSGSTTLGSGTVTFAAAFPTACDNVQITVTGGTKAATVYPLFTGGISTAGFSVYGDATQSLSFQWFAIGR